MAREGGLEAGVGSYQFRQDGCVVAEASGDTLRALDVEPGHRGRDDEGRSGRILAAEDRYGDRGHAVLALLGVERVAAPASFPELGQQVLQVSDGPFRESR